MPDICSKQSVAGVHGLKWSGQCVNLNEMLKLCLPLHQRGVRVSLTLFVCLFVCLSFCTHDSKTIAPIDFGCFLHKKECTDGSVVV